MAAVVGCVLWYIALSPYGFRRWSLDEVSGTVSFRQPGTYVIFEEFAGASTTDLSTVVVVVRGAGGRRLDVSPIADGGGTSASSYHVPGHEGRAVASFSIEAAGSYQISVFPQPSPDVTTFAVDRPGAQVAVGRDTSLTWIAAPVGLLPLAVAPALAGVALLIMARRLDSPTQ